MALELRLICFVVGRRAVAIMYASSGIEGRLKSQGLAIGLVGWFSCVRHPLAMAAGGMQTLTFNVLRCNRSRESRNIEAPDLGGLVTRAGKRCLDSRCIFWCFAAENRVTRVRGRDQRLAMVCTVAVGWRKTIGCVSTLLILLATLERRQDELIML